MLNAPDNKTHHDMENTSEKINDLPPSKKNPTARGNNKQGKDAKKKQDDKYRARKNAEFAAELKPSIFRRLRLTDPTTISAIKLQSAIVPARIPISLRALPTYVKELWLKMKLIGPKPFQSIATEANLAIFIKCFMCICEAKVCYSQITCQQVPPFPLPSIKKFTEMQLRLIKSLASLLPYPMAMFVEAIGNFMADGQPVVPMLAQASPAAASAAVSFAPSDLVTLVTYLANPVRADDVVATIAREIDDLPGLEWIPGTVTVTRPSVGTEAPAQQVELPAVSLSANTQALWSAYIPDAKEEKVFRQIISSLSVKKDLIVQCDISHGDGSIIQAVRFPKPYEPNEFNTSYYMNTLVPTFEEQLAPAFLLGFEYRVDPYSRFLSSYDECLKRGNASPKGTRHSVIWGTTTD